MDIETIKEKYPLAVDVLAGKEFIYDPCSGFVLHNGGVVYDLIEVRSWGQLAHHANPLKTQDQIGEMLADILNQLTKP